MRPFVRRSSTLLAFLSLIGAVLGACLNHTTEAAPSGTKDSVGTATMSLPPPPTVMRDTALEQRAARLELRAFERDAQIEDLQRRLDEARQEVVRALAKLQTVASRAEAASAIAEAEIALQSVRSGSSASATTLAQATALLREGGAEFAKQNYGGALYLANEAKSIAGVAQSRLAGANPGPLRAGEVPFALPLLLQAKARGNVRDGPGGGYKVLFTLDPGTALVGYSYLERWVRVADERGRAGWMFQGLLERRPPASADR